MGPSWRKWVHWEHFLKGILGLQLLPLSFCFLGTIRGKGLLTIHSCHDVLPYHRPKATGSRNHGPKPLKPFCQSELLLFISRLSQVFVMASESWLTVDIRSCRGVSHTACISVLYLKTILGGLYRFQISCHLTRILHKAVRNFSQS
jgi:hypothetical protein